MATLRKTKGSALTFDELDANFNEAQFRIGTTTVNEDIVLSDNQSSFLIGDNITLASGKSITLNGSSTLNVLSPSNIQTVVGIQRTYEPGEIVQIKYKRLDEITSMATSNSNTGVLTTDYTEFGRLRAFVPLQIDITPKFSDSLIKISFNIYGEATNHNCGFLIGEYNSTEKVFQIIRRAGYEGYNAQKQRDQQNTYVSALYDGDDNSTPRLSNFNYYDKPGTTSQKIYCIITTGTTDNTNTTFRLNRTSNASGGSVQSSSYEVGVSTIEIMEIKQ